MYYKLSLTVNIIEGTKTIEIVDSTLTREQVLSTHSERNNYESIAIDLQEYDHEPKSGVRSQTDQKYKLKTVDPQEDHHHELIPDPHPTYYASHPNQDCKNMH